jgi:hypothetical protein
VELLAAAPRRALPQVRTPVTAPDQRAPRAAAVLGLEDDPDQWCAWTALDERQLIRLLTDSAPSNRPATNSADDAIPHIEHKDTP